MSGRARRWIVLGAPTLILAGVWVLNRSVATSRSIDRSVAPIASAEDSRASTPSVAAVVREAADGTDADVASSPLEWWDEGGVAALTVRPPCDDGLAVRVVDDRTGEPEARALVFVLFQPEANGVISELKGATLADLVDLEAPCFITDERGETRVAMSGVAIHLVAVKHQLWECRRAEQGAIAPVELRLRPNRSLTVRAIGPDGRPRANVPLSFGFRSRHDSHAMLWFKATMRGVTNDAGAATFSGIDRYPAGDAVSEWGVSLDCATRERVFKSVDREAALPEVLDVPVPAFGTVRTRVVDAHGALVPIEGRALANPLDAASDPEPIYELPIQAGLSKPLTLSTGLRVAMFIESDAYTQFQGTGLGPVNDGEEAVVDVVLDDPECFEVCGTVVGEDGAALPGPFDVWFFSPTEEAGRAENGIRRVAADADGIFQMRLARSLTRHGPIRAWIQRSPPGGVLAFSDPIDVPASGDARVDLEDVVLHDGAVLAAGVVVDESDRRVPGIQISCQGSRDDRTENPWISRSLNVANTDLSGSFRFVGTSAAAEVRISAFGFFEGWRVSGDLRVSSGRTDLRLEVKAGGALAGRVLFPPRVEPSQVYAVLGIPPSSGQPLRWFANAGLERDGSFAFPSIEAGDYRFGILRRTVRATPSALVSIDDVRVESRKVNRDPRLDPVVIGDALRCVELEIADGDGRPVRSGTLHVVDRGNVGGIVDSLALDGKPIQLWIDGKVDGLIVATGFRSEWLTDLTIDRSVRLQPGLKRTLTLEFRGYASLGEKEELVARLEPVDLPLVESDWERERLGRDGVAEFWVDDPGRYRIWLKRGGGGTSDDAGTLQTVVPELLTLTADDPTTSFAITVDT